MKWRSHSNPSFVAKLLVFLQVGLPILRGNGAGKYPEFRVTLAVAPFPPKLSYTAQVPRSLTNSADWVFSNLSSILVSVLVSLIACSTPDTDGSDSDADVQLNYRLEILTPPGDVIGLGFSGSITLRVRYTGDQNQALPASEVSFKLLDNVGESTGGSSLSAAKIRTDENGLAAIELVAGAERVDFRVEVSAPQAPPAFFYIQISDQGFANLKIETVHEGPRAPLSFQRIQLRVYDEQILRCSDVDVDNLPFTLFPPRVQSEFGELSEFQNLAADEGYTIVAWAEIDSNQALATGCFRLPPQQLRSGSSFFTTIAVVDRPYKLEETLELQSQIDLVPIRSQLPGATIWQRLSCPLGVEELLLDCLVDAQESDGDLDCENSVSTTLGSQLEARRGTLGPAGCRQAVDQKGQPSIESLLQSARSGWPDMEERVALLEGRDSLLTQLTLRSILSPEALDVANHSLLSANIANEPLALISPNNPILSASGLSMPLTASTPFALQEHSFTMHLGELIAPLYENIALEPAGVEGKGAALGTELFNTTVVGNLSACAGLESFLCGELGISADCASECKNISAPLDMVLIAWIDALRTSGLDFQFSLAGTLSDTDNDLIVDSVQANNESTVTIGVSDTSVVLPLSVSSQ